MQDASNNPRSVDEGGVPGERAWDPSLGELQTILGGWTGSSALSQAFADTGRALPLHLRRHAFIPCSSLTPIPGAKARCLYSANCIERRITDGPGCRTCVGIFH